MYHSVQVRECARKYSTNPDSDESSSSVRVENLNTFEKEVLDHLCITISQRLSVAWDFVKVFQYWYEYKGIMVFAKKKSFHFFSVNSTSRKKGRAEGLVSFRQSNDSKFSLV